jgi:hypothetical protein
MISFNFYKVFTKIIEFVYYKCLLSCLLVYTFRKRVPMFTEINSLRNQIKILRNYRINVIKFGYNHL